MGRDDSDTKPTIETNSSFSVQEAATPFIDKAEAYRRYVQEGLDDIAAGRVYDWEDVKAEMDAEFGPLPA